MKPIAWLCGLLFLFAWSAQAQVNPANSLLASSSDPGMATAVTSAASAPLPAVPAFGAISASSPAAPAEPLPTIFGGPSSDNWQLYIGYTFFRLYLLPKIPLFPNGVTVDTNGINISGVRYFGTITWLGLEGGAVGTFGPTQCSKFALAGGGVRVRWQGPQGLEFWAHGTANIAHILPQTSFGGQTSFGYQVGGGIDLFTRFHDIGFRVEGDLVGTHFFSTYQRSPQISAGVVYRF